MKKLDSLIASAGTITALSFGLIHCSSEPTQANGPESGGGLAAAGAAGSGAPIGGAGAPSGLGGSVAVGNGGSGGHTNETGAAGTGSAGMSPVSNGGMAAGSGGTTAGSGAMAGAAGAATAGPNGACGSEAIVCEDFEPYPTASAPAGGWTAALRGQGKIVVDATRAFSGKQSLHVTGQMNRDHANISRPIQTASPTAYVRFMYYGTSYPASSGVHTRIARLGTAQAASGNPYTSYSLASYNGTAIERVNSIYLRDTGTKLNDPKLLNRWACLEFAVDMSGGMGKVKVHIWVDGRELALSPAGSASHGQTSASWDPLAFEVFMLGLDGYQDDTQAADYWIDDISVTTTRVGCEATPP